jgi:hypothetical protein
MASVYTVYSTLKDLANKDERGFVTPSTFNAFAALAQQNVFNSLFSKNMLSSTSKSRGLDGHRDMALSKQLREDLAFFSKESTISQVDGTFAKPADLARIIAAKTFGTFILGQTTSIPIDLIYDELKAEYIFRSTLSRPTENNPIAVVSDSITVYPTSVKKIKLKYYKQPSGINPTTKARVVSLPKFGYTVVSNKEVYDAATSVDFELPEHYTPQLIVELAKMIGVNIKDSDIFSYASSEQTKQ